MSSGTVKKIVSERGFGFITGDDGKEVFFHQSALVGMQMTSMKVGQAVTFDVERGDKGPRAVNVRAK